MRLLVGALVALSSTIAAARGGKLFTARVDLGTRKVVEIDAPHLPNTQATTPLGPKPTTAYVVTESRGIVTVKDTHNSTILQVSAGVPGSMPWWIGQAHAFVYDWREVLPDHTTRDVVRGVFWKSASKELWRREVAAGTAAVAVDDDRIVLATGGNAPKLELVDTTNGTSTPLAIPGTRVAIVPIDGGDVLLDTGEAIARLDPHGAIRWQAVGLGPIETITHVVRPDAAFRMDGGAKLLGAAGDWIVLTKQHLARIDPASGKVVWSQPTTATEVLVDGPRVFTAELAVAAPRTAIVTLVVRDLARGAQIHAIELRRYASAFDQAFAQVLAVHHNVVEVQASFIVLD